MAKIGSIYLAGKELPQNAPEHFSSGIAFPLRAGSGISHIWNSDDSNWQVELKRDHTHVVARSHHPLDYENLVTGGLEQIQRCLDIIAVKKIGLFCVCHPELDNVAVFQENRDYVLRHFSVSSLGIEATAKIEVRDKEGNIVPPTPIPEPTWTWAFRYYRLSQTSEDIFEAYRNLFLSLEALLNEICPKQPSEREKKWLERAFSDIGGRVNLSHHVPDAIDQPIDYLIKTQYTDIRCRLFHAKYPDGLLPHDELNPTDVLAAYETLLRLWCDIAETYCNVPRGGGVVTYQGFKLMMDKMFSQSLSLQFTEDSSPPKNEDTTVSPLGFAAFNFAKSSYVGQTKPGFVSWQGKLSRLNPNKYPFVYRICSKLGDTLFNVSFVRDGLSPTGVDIFETYQSVRLVNKSQPKTSF